MMVDFNEILFIKPDLSRQRRTMAMNIDEA
jgi:hypothetical protein